MRKKIILLLLIFTILTGCKEKEITTSEEVVETNPQVALEDNKDNPELTKKEEEENINPEEEIEDEEISNAEIDLSIEEEVKVLEENSDYISLIKMSQTGSSGKEIYVLEDIKGSIKNIVIPDIPNMEPNYNYLVFLMDSDNGDITLTDIERGLVKVDNESNEYLSSLRELLQTPADDKKEN